jgi:hypothetical protein
MEGPCGLDEASFDGVMACQATRAQATTSALPDSDALDLDAFLERWPSAVRQDRVQREEHHLWNEIHGGSACARS